jgi:WhiB family redox-sensing transcriptional regulator
VSWRDQAACANRGDIDWFPTVELYYGANKTWRENVERAKHCCAACPVKAECLSMAMADPMTAGIWGGTTESERRRRPRPPRRPQVAHCGTDAGYYRHLRQTLTEPCVACRDAHAAAWRHRKRSTA